MEGFVFDLQRFAELGKKGVLKGMLKAGNLRGFFLYAMSCQTLG